MVINPIVGVYIPIIRIPIKGGMTIPNIATGLKSSPTCGEPVCPGATNEDFLGVAMDISPNLYAHLLDYEILAGPAIFERKGCILVNELSRFDENRVWGKICESPFGNLSHLDQTGFYGIKQSGQEALIEANDLLETILGSTMVLLYSYELTAGRGEFPSQALRLRPSSTSFLVPWDGKHDSTKWMVDLFAGGYGGWSYSLQFLTEDIQRCSLLTAFPPHAVIAIEQDTPAAASHAHNHKMNLLPDERLPYDWFRKFPQPTVINAPIQSHNWKQSVALLSTDLWTISHPCQSWTNAAHAKGFEDQNGLSFASALGLIRVYRPRYVALENVKNFQDHCQFPLVQSLVKWAGYRILHQGIYDASQQLPVKRPRYLAVLQKVEEQDHPFTWNVWNSLQHATPHGWDAWTSTPQQEFHQFTLAPEAKCMYLDPKLLPKGINHSFQHDMMKFRVPMPNQKLPVFMAAYGSHHHLPYSLLKDKGMHGFFTRENGTFRWFKPEEILMLHSHPCSCTLLKPAELSWKFLGNSIVVHHGIMTLTNILGHQYGAKSNEEFQSIFEVLSGKRLRANNTVIHSDDFAWYLGTKEEIIHQQNRLRFLSDQMKWTGDPDPKWPGGFFFHQEYGLQRLQTDSTSIPCQIPQTIEDSSDDDKCSTSTSLPVCEVTIAASPGTYGTLQIEDLWQWNDVHDLWGDKFQPYSIEGNFLSPRDIPPKAILLPTQDEQGIQNSDEQRHAILWDDDQGSRCLLVVHEIQWKDVQRDHPRLADYLYDDHGRIPPELKFRKSMKVMIEPHMCQPFPDLGNFVTSFASVGMIAMVPQNTDILAVVFTGPTKAIIDVLTFWHYALNDSWLESHARQLCFQVEDDMQARIVFRPSGQKFATPTDIFRSSIQAQLIKTVFESYHSPALAAIVKVQFEHRYIAEIALPKNQTFAEFYQLCQHETLFSNNGLTPALIVGMKRVGEDVTVGKLVDHFGQAFRCIVGPTIVGGGAKSNHKQSVQASLASVLIEEGVKLEEVSKHVQSVIKQIGLPKLTQILFVETEPAKHDQIQTILQECDIPRQQKTARISTSKAKYTKVCIGSTDETVQKH